MEKRIQRLEVCHKETEEVIVTPEATFLSESISYLQSNKEHFIYLESDAFEALKMEAVVLEFDEMFEVYTALFGLKLQKKMSGALKNYLRDHLKGMLGSSSALFNGDEGLWEINIALNAIDGFTGEETIEQSVDVLLQFVEKMLESVTEA